MSIDFDHETVRGLLAASALGAVDAAEREGVEAHLRACEPCRAEHLRYQWTATALSGTSDRVWDQIAGAVTARRAKLDRVLRELVSLYDPEGERSEARVVVASDMQSVALGRSIGQDRRFAVVGVAADVLDAVSITAAHEPDLLLMVLSRPRREWLEAVSTVGQWSPGTKVVVVTGVDASQVAEMVRHGAEVAVWREEIGGGLTEPAPEPPPTRPEKTGRAARRSIIDEAMWHIGIGPRSLA